MKTLAAAISNFGASVKAKLANPAIAGAPEDQLRGPLESLIRDLAEIVGVARDAVGLVGETTLSAEHIRPDYAVTVHNALVGYIEVKAPGKGVNPRTFSGAHDKAQWAKLKPLPNLLYTDGNGFSLWRDGEPAGKVLLDGEVSVSGAALAAPETLLTLLNDFLSWQPIAPKTARQLAEVSARLCRLLRDEVVEQMALGSPGLTELAAEWRKLLFPEADDRQFADGYAQAVTFGLLIARAQDIPLTDGIDHAAIELRKTNSLIGTALRLLTDDDANRKALKTSLDTLARVLDVVNWHTLSKDKPEAWLYFYEDFLQVYDNALRKLTGSYYTPPEVVAGMVRLADEALRGPLFGRASGLASTDVVVADPAIGAGTFLLGVLRQIAATVAEDQGAGAVPGAIAAAAQRLIGFELQFGPFAVAQVRLLAEMQALLQSAPGAASAVPNLRLFITDTLGNPFVEDEQLSQVMQPIAKSRRDANTVKRDERITVVIGNPPYKEKAKGKGGWIEKGAGDQFTAPLDRWKPPREWKAGVHSKHLRNLYVYFWRWATWKVFGTGHYAATGLPEPNREGIVCFITAAGFLGGDGFQRMREDLRQTCSEIWIIDCSPEGHQPEVATRFFEGVQHPVCIAIAARRLSKSPTVPARVRYRALPKGLRDEKFAALAAMSLNDSDWIECSSGWRAPFFPDATGQWATMPLLAGLFAYDGSGVMPGRTWVIAPDPETLRKRWRLLVAEKNAEKKEKLFHPQLREGKVASRHIRKSVAQPLGNKPTRQVSILNDEGPSEAEVPYAFRSFDRQWLIGDARLLNDVRPSLWRAHSGRQVYITAPEAAAPRSGPALTFTALVPDQDHYNGRGGRVLPLWRDAAATQPNVRTALLETLAEMLGRPVSAEDVMAYLAAAMAHPAFTARFAADLLQPGLRVPLTADAALFAEAVALGREIVWLHTYGERFADPAAGRPAAPPRLPKDRQPTIPAGGTIPGAPEPLPDAMDYDPAARRLTIGKGHVANVTPAMWNYEVSGKNVLRQWFSYRRLDRTKPLIGDRRPPSPLDGIQADAWPAEYTTDLLNLLNVLGRLTDLEPAQAALLARILDAPLLDVGELVAAGAIEAAG